MSYVVCRRAAKTNVMPLTINFMQHMHDSILLVYFGRIS